MYILTNRITGRYYIGSTNNLTKRIKQHRNGHTRTTKILGTYELIYFEKFDSIQDARIRERKIKSYKSRNYINWLINNTGR